MKMEKRAAYSQISKTAKAAKPGHLYHLSIVKLLIIGLTLLGTTPVFLGCESSNNVTPREGALEGTITDKSGTALATVLVSWAYDPTRWGRTDTKGNFTVEGVGFGDQIFVAEKTGYRKKSFQAAIYSGTITTIKQVIMETATFEYTNISVDEVSATHAVISWKTTDYTNGVIECGETESLGRTIRETESQYATAHTLTITDLKPQTRYYFKIIASRQNQPSETSVISDFTTLSALEDRKVPDPPKGAGAALSEQPNQVTVFWAANSEADLKGYKLYRCETPNGTFAAVNNGIVAKGQERYVDVGVVTGKKYYYRVSAIDQANNESGPSECVSMVIPGNLTQQVLWTRANSPYILAGDLDIQSTGLLRLDSGVVVKMADYDALRRGNANIVEIRVAGGIVASASKTEVPVVFTSDRSPPAAGDWGGISINSDGSTSSLANVTLAYAGTALSLSKKTGTFNGVSILNCNTGIIATQTTDLLLTDVSITYCETGMEISDNVRLKIDGCSFNHTKRGILSNLNDTLTIQRNDFLEYTDFGLTTNDSYGDIIITNNLFISPSGLGLHIIDKPPKVDYNTFDSAYGIQIDKGNPIIEKNLIGGQKSYTGIGLKGIEHLAGEQPLPLFGPNSVYGFTLGKDYIGCASTSTSLASEPMFMKDWGSTTYDYRLKQGYPNNTDPWGIRRTTAPSVENQ